MFFCPDKISKKSCSVCPVVSFCSVQYLLAEIMIKASYTHLYIFVYKGVKGNLTLILIYFEFSSVKSCGLAEMVTEDILEGKKHRVVPTFFPISPYK